MRGNPPARLDYTSDDMVLNLGADCQCEHCQKDQDDGKQAKYDSHRPDLFLFRIHSRFGGRVRQFFHPGLFDICHVAPLSRFDRGSLIVWSGVTNRGLLFAISSLSTIGSWTGST
jgi:hypothetical protein